MRVEKAEDQVTADIRGAINNNPDNMDISSTRIDRGLMTEKELKSSTF